MLISDIVLKNCVYTIFFFMDANLCRIISNRLFNIIMYNIKIIFFLENKIKIKIMNICTIFSYLKSHYIRLSFNEFYQRVPTKSKQTTNTIINNK